MRTCKHFAICTIALIAATSCNKPDPAGEAVRVNDEIAVLIAGCDTTATPVVRYRALLQIREQADSITHSAAAQFKRKKLETFQQGIIHIAARPEYLTAWNAMARANRAELQKIPSGIWLVNADNPTVNTLFMLDRKREHIVPYNIKGSNSLDLEAGNGLVYAPPLEGPIFFQGNDSSRTYTIEIPGRYAARFRKAQTADLAMGYYELSGNIPSQDLKGYDRLDIRNGRATFGNEENKISFDTEVFLGVRLKRLRIGNIPLYMLEKESRSGCYDCWAIFSGFSFGYQWMRQIEGNAKNILYIFGTDESVWNPIETEQGYDGSEQNHDGAERSSRESGKDWDRILDTFEEYVDSYVKLARKAAQGDMAAISRYAEFAQKAQELSEQLADTEEDLTPEQQQRYLRILGRMTSAAWNPSSSSSLK